MARTMMAATLAGLVLAVSPASEAGETVSLAGEWAFRLDPHDRGVQEGWTRLLPSDRITLPGSTDQAGYGARALAATVGKLTREYSYVGPAWYVREVDIPEAWSGKRIVLFLERCHWETRVFVDGTEAGMHNSLSTPHVHDLSAVLTPGRHLVAIRVDNTVSIPIGEWGHAITDETQTNWNGIIGRIELQATDPVWIEAIRTFPDLKRGTAHVEVRLRDATGLPAAGHVTLTVEGGEPASVAFAPGAETVTAELRVPEAERQWDEFSPELHRLRVELRAGECSDVREVIFGMREFAATGTKFALNGRRIFLRGTLDCAIYPLTGYPPTDVQSWARIIRIIRSYGLNHMRFHSWCPPEAAFVAADQAGVILQVEAPLWVAGDPDPDSGLAEYIRQETRRIVDAYGNHPSFCLMSMGNELLMEQGPSPYLQGLVEELRQHDPRHLYTCSTHPLDLRRNDDFFVSASGPGGALRGHGRLNSQRPSTDHDWAAALAGVTRPTIAHELGQWGVYANLAEIPKYTGHLKPRAWQAYVDGLAERGVLEQAADFTRASGAFSVLLYKEEIETALRTDRLAGFQLLDLHDFPGQGVALVGMLDAFWDSKGLATPREFRRYCSATVPLLRLPKRAYVTDETIEAVAELAHYGSHDLQDAHARWAVRTASGHTIARGAFAGLDIPTGGTTRLGGISVPLGDVQAPAKLVATLAVDGTAARNTWDLWVYPAATHRPAVGRIHVSTAWDDEACEAVRNRKAVVLLIAPGTLRETVPASFTPVFWCTRLFPNQPGTMGILADQRHPALAEFPTETHANWQWWEILRSAPPVILDQAPPDYRPIVQMIDNYDRNHKLGVVFEARVGEGRLLVASADLQTDLDHRPATRQLRRSLLAYAASDRFQPKQQLSVSLLDQVLRSWAVVHGADRPSAQDRQRAVLDVVAGANVGLRQSPAWRPEHDRVVARAEGFGYSIAGGSWLDETSSAWHAADLGVTVTCPQGFTGVLYAHFHDWNSQERSGFIRFESLDFGALGDHTGDGVWVAFPIDRDASADGRVSIQCECTRGPNLMISEIVLVPE